jgi:Flp pilus assembly pilin Flp
MLALLIVAMFATIATLGKTSNSSFENTSTKLQAAANSGS